MGIWTQNGTQKVVNTVPPWTTHVWTVWVHFYMSLFPKTILENVLEMCNDLKKLADEPGIIIKKTSYKIYNILWLN